MAGILLFLLPLHLFSLLSLLASTVLTPMWHRVHSSWFHVVYSLFFEIIDNVKIVRLLNNLNAKNIQFFRFFVQIRIEQSNTISLQKSVRVVDFALNNLYFNAECDKKYSYLLSHNFVRYLINFIFRSH